MAQPISGKYYLIIGIGITVISIFVNMQKPFGIFIIIGLIMVGIGVVKKFFLEKGKKEKEAVGMPVHQIHNTARQHQVHHQQKTQQAQHQTQTAHHPTHTAHAQAKFCPKCRTHLKIADKFCNNCGNRV